MRSSVRSWLKGKGREGRAKGRGLQARGSGARLPKSLRRQFKFLHGHDKSARISENTGVRARKLNEAERDALNAEKARIEAEKVAAAEALAAEKAAQEAAEKKAAAETAEAAAE